MSSNRLIHAFILSAVAVAAIRYIPVKDTEIQRGQSLGTEVHSETDRRLPRDGSAKEGSDRKNHTRETGFLSLRERGSTSPGFDGHLALGSAHGFDLETRIRDRLKNPDPEERIAALEDLYGLDDAIAVHLLHEILLGERNGTVHQAATEMLTEIAGAAAVATVTTALNDQDVAVRRQAIETLGGVGLHGLSYLGQFLLGDPEPDLRWRALELLAANASPAALALLEAGVEDMDPEISRAAQHVLSSQGGIRDQQLTAEVREALYIGHAVLADESDNPILSLSRSSQPEERIEAVQRVYVLEEAEAVSTLKVVLERDEHASVREEALFALESIGGEAATAAVTTALRDDSPELRRLAMNAVSRSKKSVALPILGQMLYGDPDPELRLEAVHLVSLEAGPAAHALLIAACEDPDERVRLAASQSLGR